MKAIRVAQFGGPEELHLVDVPDPVPGPGDVAVQLHAAGVNPVDAYVRSGQYARLPQLPYTPGADGAGVITALYPAGTVVLAMAILRERTCLAQRAGLAVAAVSVVLLTR